MSNRCYQYTERAQYKKNSGPDKIWLKVLKELAEDVAPHLTSIFSTSLEIHRIHDQWKTFFVASIIKNGERNNAANYRPVSLTSVWFKMCVHIIAIAVMQHL